MMACSVPVKAQNPATQTITLSDGGRYTGQVLHGKPNVKGQAVYKNGDVYEGEFLKGKRHGQGTYTFTDGEKYTGEWFQDHQHGMGDYYFMNGNRSGNIICQYQIQICFNELSCLNTFQSGMCCQNLLGHRHSHRQFILSIFTIFPEGFFT